MAMAVFVVAAAAVSAFSAIQAGRAQEQQAAFERAQAEDNRELAKLQAAQEETDRRKQLAAILAAQDAEAAAQGLGVGNYGSFAAGQKAERELAERDVESIRLMGQLRARQYGLQAQQSSAAGKAARTAGYLKATSTMLGAGASLFGKGKT